MATPPRVTPTEAAAAVRRITRRHRKVDDPRLEQLGTDPRDVLDYLGRYSEGLPRWVRQADVADSLTLGVWLWWEDRRRLRATLRSGRNLGLFLTQLGAFLGIRTAQGTQDLIDRLDALLLHDRPDEKLTREARRVAAADQDGSRSAWIELHRDELHDITGQLLTAATRYQVEDREWLDELAVDHMEGRYTPASMVLLGLAAAEVRTATTVTELKTAHAVHRVLATAERLRSEFARLT